MKKNIDIFKYSRYIIILQKMDKIQTVIVVLLIIAIVFSAVSIALNISLKDFKPVNGNAVLSAGNTAGNVQLMVEGNSYGVK